MRRTNQSPVARLILRPAPVAAVVTAVCAAALVGVGTENPGAAIASLAAITGEALPLAVCWIASAWGLGIACDAVLGLRGSMALALVLGAAVLMWVDHLAGMCGLLSPIASWALLAPGWVALVFGIRKARAPKRDTSAGTSWWLVLCAPPAALLIVAACLPPGTIWASEAHGYDVLSYHLALPKLWVAQGRVWPIDTNVYSYLPSSMEAAFARLAAISGIDAASPHSLGAGSGTAIYAAQFLHVLFVGASAWCVGTVVRELVPGTRASRIGAASAGTAMMGVPWVIVTGSMAYNEMALCALIAGALVAAVLPSETPVWKRGIAVGVCIGAACSIKPTAMFLGAPPAAILLAAQLRPREWVRAFSGAAAAGVAMLAPWMVRNAIASGNPVFPSASGVFGDGPWSPEQHARWHAAHHLELSVRDRMDRLFSSEFGLMHPQWSVWAILVGAAVLVCFIFPAARRASWVLILAAAAQVAAWLTIGHLQSRFLIPIVVTTAPVVGIALAELVRHRARLGVALAAILPVVMCGDSVRLFARENDGDPMRGLIGGVEVLNGSAVQSPGPPGASREAKTFYMTVGPTLLINQVMLRSSPSPRILVMGDATMLYIDDTGEMVRWTSAWDANPVMAALDAAGDDVDRAIDHLRDVDGFTHILINAAELDRLRDSGYADPRITPELGLAIARRTGVVVSWPDRGMVLVSLQRPAVDSPPR